jgi:ABC-type transporter Mla MlaB component
MNFVTLSIPAKLTLDAALTFTQQIGAQPNDLNFISFDFSNFGRVEPFGMLVVAHAIRQFKNRSPKTTIVPTGLPQNDAESYASHMGFFKACDISLGKNPGQAKGNTRYLPITYQSTADLATGGEHLGTQIERLSLKLAQMLTQQTSGVLVDTLTYSFREIIRNVAEHSQSPDFGYCAQYLYAEGTVEIALIDQGIGLRTSLAHNPFVAPHLTDDRDALKYAIMPGISGKAYKGAPQKADDVWNNSGFGLYMNYRLCNEGGSFFIANGDAGLHREHGDDNRYHNCHLPGVGLRLRLDVSKLNHLDEMLKRFAKEGESVAQQFSEGAVPNASATSKMIRYDFSALKRTFTSGMIVKHRQWGIVTVISIQDGTQGTILTVQLKGGGQKRVPGNDVTIIEEQP